MTSCLHHYTCYFITTHTRSQPIIYTVVWWRLEPGILKYWSAWFFVETSHSHQHSHLRTASELLRHLLDVWKKRSSELGYCTTQTPLPTLNQQHSTALQYIQHFLSSLCQLKRAPSVLQPPSPSRCTGQLWLWVLALTHQPAQGKQHITKHKGEVTSSDCGS